MASHATPHRPPYLPDKFPYPSSLAPGTCILRKAGNGSLKCFCLHRPSSGLSCLSSSCVLFLVINDSVYPGTKPPFPPLSLHTVTQSILPSILRSTWTTPVKDFCISTPGYCWGSRKNGLCCCSKDFPKQSYGLFNAFFGRDSPFPVEDQRFLSIKQELVPEYSEIPARPGPVL